MVDIAALDHGLDLSNWNEVADWAAVAGNRIRYVSIKLTEGVGWIDWRADEHVHGARSVGIAAGGYHFARPGDPVAQADDFADQLLRLNLTGAGCMAPMLDMEDDAIADKDGFIRAFQQQVHDRTGVACGLVYAQQSWYSSSTINPETWSEDTLAWLAVWNGQPGVTGWSHSRLVLHQHTNQGVVPGIPEHVDRNATLPGVDMAAFVLGGDGSYTPPPPAPSPEPDLRGRYRVQSGDTLSAIAAEFGTTVDALAAVNGIANEDYIQAGWVLTIPHGDTDSGGYTIQPGDTLSGLAAAFDTTVDAIMAANPYVDDPNVIYAGNHLVIPQ